MSDVDCSRVSSVSFFFSSPPHVIKGAARGGCIYVRQVGWKESSPSLDM